MRVEARDEWVSMHEQSRRPGESPRRSRLGQSPLRRRFEVGGGGSPVGTQVPLQHDDLHALAKHLFGKDVEQDWRALSDSFLAEGLAPRSIRAQLTTTATGQLQARMLELQRPPSRQPSPLGRGAYVQEVVDHRSRLFCCAEARSQRTGTLQPQPRLRHGTVQEHLDIRGRRSTHMSLDTARGEVGRIVRSQLFGS